MNLPKRIRALGNIIRNEKVPISPSQNNSYCCFMHFLLFFLREFTLVVIIVSRLYCSQLSPHLLL